MSLSNLQIINFRSRLKTKHLNKTRSLRLTIDYPIPSMFSPHFSFSFNFRLASRRPLLAEQVLFLLGCRSINDIPTEERDENRRRNGSVTPVAFQLGVLHNDIVYQEPCFWGIKNECKAFSPEMSFLAIALDGQTMQIWCPRSDAFFSPLR